MVTQAPERWNQRWTDILMVLFKQSFGLFLSDEEDEVDGSTDWMVKKLIGVIFGLDHESKRVFEIGEMMEFVVIVSG